MNLGPRGSRYGIAQYRYPLSHQLAGTSYTLLDDGGAVHRLDFTGRDRVTLTFDGAAPEVSVYECLPVAADVYLVSFEVAPRFAVLDLARGYAVVVDLAADRRIVAAVQGIGDPATIPVAVTDEMTGTSVRWVLGTGREFRQEYLEKSVSRQSWSPRHDRVKDCPATYLTLADGLYVVLVDGVAPPGTDLPQGLGHLVMVQDFEHMTLVGCALSTVFNERVLFAGYGQFADEGTPPPD